jgi:hypothetical protein
VTLRNLLTVTQLLLLLQNCEKSSGISREFLSGTLR